MEWVLAALVGGVGAIGVWVSVSRSLRQGRSRQATVEERWRAVADRLHGELTVVGSGALSARKLLLKVLTEDAIVRASASVPADPATPSHTRVWASFILGVGPAFSASEASTPPKRGFDFRAKNMSRSERAWTEEIEARANAFPRMLTVRSDGNRVELLWNHVEMNIDVLTEALSIAAGIASADLEGFQELTKIDGATYEPDPGALPVIRIRRGSATLRLTIEGDGDAAAFVISAPARKGIPKFSVLVDEDGELAGELPPGVVDSSSVAWAQVGPCRVRGDADAVAIVFRETPGLERAEAGVRLLAAVAETSSGGGAFR